MKHITTFSVGNRVDAPLQKIHSSLPVGTCKNTAMTLPKGGMDAEGEGGGEGLAVG